MDVNDDVLTIHVKEERSEEETKKNYIRKERRVSEMSRSLRFTDVNLDHIQAKLEEGILKIYLPKLKLVENKKKLKSNNCLWKEKVCKILFCDFSKYNCT